MSFEFNSSSSRSWRDIPQPVKPRAMSREGRRRLTLAILRITIVSSVIGGVGWGSWEIARAVRERSGPAAAKGERVADIHLITDGSLDKAWVLRTLALPKTATLLNLDLDELCHRVAAHGQVIHATVVRDFPATLVVRVTERSPVARVMAEVAGGPPQMLFVAQDGMVFPGVGFNPEMIETLPWLDGVKLVQSGTGFLPIAGMSMVRELLAKAKLQAEHLYLTWHVVSLAKLESDGEIEVRTKQDALRVRFSTQQDFFPQLARLDFVIDESMRRRGVPATSVDLTHGDHIPVTLAAENLATPGALGDLAPAAVSKPFALPAFPHLSRP